MMLTLARKEIARLQEQMKQDAVTREAENDIFCEAREAKTGLTNQLDEANTRHEKFVAECTEKIDAQHAIFKQARAKRNTAITAIEAAERAVEKLQEEINGMLPQPVPKQDMHIKKEAVPVAPVVPVPKEVKPASVPPVAKRAKPMEQASVPPKEIVLPKGIVYRTSIIPEALINNELVQEAWRAIEDHHDVHIGTTWQMLRFCVRQECPENAELLKILHIPEEGQEPDSRLADFQKQLMATVASKAKTTEAADKAKAAAKAGKAANAKAANAAKAKEARAAKAAQDPKDAAEARSKRPLLDPSNGAAAQPRRTMKQAIAQQVPEPKQIEVTDTDEEDVFDSEESAERSDADEQSDDEGRNLLCWDRFDGEQGSWRPCVVEKFEEWAGRKHTEATRGYPFLSLSKLSVEARAKLQVCTLRTFQSMCENYEQEFQGQQLDEVPQDMEAWCNYFIMFFPTSATQFPRSPGY
jgi:hypothetical protein